MTQQDLTVFTFVAVLAVASVIALPPLTQTSSRAATPSSEAPTSIATAPSEASPSVEAAPVVVQAAAGGQVTVWDGVYTEAQAARAEPVYKAKCTRCHAGTLSGTPGAPGLKGGIFFQKWEGLSAADVFAFASSAMPPDAPGSLRPTEYVDLIAFIFSKNKFPAGDKELPNDLDAMSLITVTKKKP